MAAAPLINRLKLAAQVTGRPRPPDPKPVVQSVRSDAEGTVGETPTLEPKPGLFVTAASASPVWLIARDNFIGHLMGCHSCHAPTNRYCALGAQLRARYNETPMRDAGTQQQ